MWAGLSTRKGPDYPYALWEVIGGLAAVARGLKAERRLHPHARARCRSQHKGSSQRGFSSFAPLRSLALQLATIHTWRDLTTMMTAVLPSGSSGNASDIMLLLEAGRRVPRPFHTDARATRLDFTTCTSLPPTRRPSASIVPMANLSDRPFWIPGETVSVSFRDLYATDPEDSVLMTKFPAGDNKWTASCFAASGLSGPRRDRMATGVACSSKGFNGALQLRWALNDRGTCEGRDGGWAGLGLGSA